MHVNRQAAVEMWVAGVLQADPFGTWVSMSRVGYFHVAYVLAGGRAADVPTNGAFSIYESRSSDTTHALSACPSLSQARLDYESSLPKHLFESFVFRDAQMTVRYLYLLKTLL